MEIAKSPHLGKLRVTLHFIQVTFHGIIPKNYARLESGYREKALKTIRGSAVAVLASLFIPTCVNYRSPH